MQYAKYDIKKLKVFWYRQLLAHSAVCNAKSRNEKKWRKKDRINDKKEQKLMRMFTIKRLPKAQ